MTEAIVTFSMYTTQQNCSIENGVHYKFEVLPRVGDVVWTNAELQVQLEAFAEQWELKPDAPLNFVRAIVWRPDALPVVILGCHPDSRIVMMKLDDNWYNMIVSQMPKPGQRVLIENVDYEVYVDRIIYLQYANDYVVVLSETMPETPVTVMNEPQVRVGNELIIDDRYPLNVCPHKSEYFEVKICDQRGYLDIRTSDDRSRDY